MRSFANKQKGLALITVLFIFALVSLLAISMQSRQKMSMAQASASINLTQAQLLALSVEDVAKAGLVLDGNRDQDANELWDTSAEQWNQFPPIEEGGATIEIYIRDLQGLFNLNSLSPSPTASDSVAARLRFERLLGDIGISSASTIADQVKDWLDSTSSASSTYQNMEPPYSASGFEFSHPSELLLIEGIDKETYSKIEPYVTALPGKTPLNINTTAPQILSSWDSALTIDDATTLVNKTHPGSCGPTVRNGNVFEKDDLWAEAVLDPLIKKSETPEATGSWEETDFSVNTQYFSLLIRVQINGQDMMLESIIKRDMTPDEGFVGVVYRDFSRKPSDIDRLKINKC